MAQHIVLLRGINLGPRNRIAMPELRGVLTAAGFEEVRTYLQSGNVVLSSKAKADEVARETQHQIAERFGLEIAVVVRTRAQLARVVELNPLQKVVTNSKRYQVSFLDTKPTQDILRHVKEAAVPPEQVVAIGREIYAWHPDGIGRSRLWTLLAGRRLGVSATARNWTTVTNLLSLARE